MNKETEKAAWGGAFDAFGKMWERIRTNPQPTVVLVVVYVALALVQVGRYGYEAVKSGESTGVFGFDALYFLLFLLALPTYALALAKGKVITVSEFLQFNAKRYFTLLGASILVTLAAMGSLLLFIIPAIWVIAWFAVFQMAILDKNLGVIESLKESKRLAKDHKGKVWGVIGATVLFTIGASLLIVVPVVGFWLGIVASSLITVLSSAVLASLYLWLKAQQ